MTVTLHAGDNRETLRRLIDQGVRVHSVVSDPPYGLTSITKRFGKEGSAPARSDNNDGAFGRLSRGFMQKSWDGTGIERDPEFWKLVYDILLPGGYCFAFSGSRTGHWQACAMETAGFIMHPMHGWVYGSGMSKQHNAARAVDNELGLKGSYGEPKSAAHAGWIERGRMRGGEGHEGWQRPWMDDPEQVAQSARRYIPASPEAEAWDGWAYGTQAQKPSLEPIYLAQKPYSEKTGGANLLKHGVGAVNIDDCRLPRGSHPSNLILDGSPEVVALFPNGKSGTGAVKRASSKQNNGNTSSAFGAESRPTGAVMNSYGDEGSNSRFFHHFPLDDDAHVTAISMGLIDGNRGDAIVYHRKADKSDRWGSEHPTVKPVGLLQYLIRHITPPGGTVLDMFAGSGTTAVAAEREGFDCILMEGEPEYVDFLRARFDSRADIGINTSYDLSDLLLPSAGATLGNDLADILS